MEKHQMIEQSIIKKFRPQIWRMFVKAIDEYKLVEENDKIAVCISGGKDSMLLAKCMEELKKHGNVKFDIVYLSMNPGYSKENLDKLKHNATLLNINLEMFDTNIFDFINKTTDSPCYVCARMRRGYLYNEAQKRGCNKIALGHHFDDVIETVLMSMFYGAEYKTMMPKLISKNYQGMELIRPLYLVKEQSIMDWCNYNELDFLKCSCHFTDINNYQSFSKRKEIKELIKNLKKQYNDIDVNIFRSFHNVNLNTIIGYHNDSVHYHFLDDYDMKKKKS